jgi:hypothetical protein
LPSGGVDIIAAGRQFVAFGTHPVTGRPYEWVGNGTPLDVPADALPQVSSRQLISFQDQALKLYTVRRHRVPGRPGNLATASQSLRCRKAALAVASSRSGM